jgi:hypothetical protein
MVIAERYWSALEPALKELEQRAKGNVPLAPVTAVQRVTDVIHQELPR